MNKRPENTVSAIINKMMEKDLFSQWLGVERLSESKGFCQIRMTVRDEMCNGFSIAHGGIAYSLADSALAFASNSHGKHAVSVETSISHLKPIRAGETIIATAEETSCSNRIGVYVVRVENENGELAALFKGVVFRKETVWDI